jgi:hypothetical protein
MKKLPVVKPNLKNLGPENLQKVLSGEMRKGNGPNRSKKSTER